MHKCARAHTHTHTRAIYPSERFLGTAFLYVSHHFECPDMKILNFFFHG